MRKRTATESFHTTQSFDGGQDIPHTPFGHTPLARLRGSPLSLSDLHVPTPDELRKPRLKPSGANAFKTLCRILRTEDIESPPAKKHEENTRPLNWKEPAFRQFPNKGPIDVRTVRSPSVRTVRSPNTQRPLYLTKATPPDRSLARTLGASAQNRSTISFKPSEPKVEEQPKPVERPPVCVKAWNQLKRRASPLFPKEVLQPKPLSPETKLSTYVEIHDVNGPTSWGWKEESLRGLIETFLLHVESSRMKQRILQESLTNAQRQNARLKEKLQATMSKDTPTARLTRATTEAPRTSPFRRTVPMPETIPSTWVEDNPDPPDRWDYRLRHPNFPFPLNEYL
eukprot:Blabericola_migrator_1__1513@NODE_139_length_13119_cov_94_960389_g121_i0_p5_GENE_NODE_139_length_13119_cov_94_960389_g121_i0NODE_139_length_13119_cov_94_960389_g121_i0_p5_ORF_typecomplete_len340_score56_66KIAA1430/PF13879_6/0_013UPF0242/PF06785_11/0_21_NODE_139_length_13119_cov_94_960389_g121_i078838902